MITVIQVQNHGAILADIYNHFVQAMAALYVASEATIAARSALSMEEARLTNSGTVEGTNEAVRKASLIGMTATLREVLAQAEANERATRHLFDVVEQHKKSATRQLQIFEIIGRAGGVTLGPLPLTPEGGGIVVVPSADVAEPKTGRKQTGKGKAATVEPAAPPAGGEAADAAQADAGPVALLDQPTVREDGLPENPNRWMNADEQAILEAMLDEAGFDEGQKLDYLSNGSGLKLPRTHIRLNEFEKLTQRFLPPICALARVKRGEYRPGDGVLLFGSTHVPQATAESRAHHALGLTLVVTSNLSKAFAGVTYDGNGNTFRNTAAPDKVDTEHFTARLALEFKPAPVVEADPDPLVNDEQAAEVRAASKKHLIPGKLARDLLIEFCGVDATVALRVSQARELIDTIFPNNAPLPDLDEELV